MNGFISWHQKILETFCKIEHKTCGVERKKITQVVRLNQKKLWCLIGILDCFFGKNPSEIKSGFSGRCRIDLIMKRRPFQIIRKTNFKRYSTFTLTYTCHIWSIIISTFYILLKVVVHFPLWCEAWRRFLLIAPS